MYSIAIDTKSTFSLVLIICRAGLKVLEEEYSNFYDDKKNLNNAFFNNYYWQSGNEYKAVREYRNKVEFEVFNREDDAIYWCSNYEKTKAKIMKNNIRPLNLNEMVFEYKT